MPADMPFHDWVRFVFDHPVTDPAWHWDLDAPDWDAPNDITCEYVTRLFQESGELLQPYSNAQVNQGLWYIVDQASSEILLSALNEDEVTWTLRKECVLSILTLYEECFAKRCSEHLSHCYGPDADALNVLCYMWWDLFPTNGGRCDPEKGDLDAVCLDVMRQIFDIWSEPCRESVLRGLGHWHAAYPTRVAMIVAQFIHRDLFISDDLRDYAFAAMNGDVW